MTVHAEAFAGGAKQRQQDDREGVEEKKPVAPLWVGDAKNAHAHAKPKVLRVAKTRLDRPALGVQVHDLARARLRVAGGQTPGLFHIPGLDADNSGNLVPTRRDLGVAQLARSSALAYPGGGGARLAIGRADMNVAAKPDDISKTQRVEKAKQLGVAKTAIGENRRRDALGQQLRQAGEANVLEVVALVLQLVLQHSQPQQGRRPAVIGDKAQVQRRLIVGVEIRPVH